MTRISQNGYKDEEGESNLTKYCVLTGSSDQSLRLFNIFKEPRVLKSEEETVASQHILEYRGCITVHKSGSNWSIISRSFWRVSRLLRER